jgi:excisionase family DNA binding protein
MIEKIYKSDEARAILECSPATFYTMIRTGRLRATKCGRAYRACRSNRVKSNDPSTPAR